MVHYLSENAGLSKGHPELLHFPLSINFRGIAFQLNLIITLRNFKNTKNIRKITKFDNRNINVFISESNIIMRTIKTCINRYKILKKK